MKLIINKTIVIALKKLGFKVKEKSGADWSDLSRYNTLRNVIIVSWMLKGYIGHFSVLEKTTKDSIHIADSEEGKIIKLPRAVFLRLWFDYDEMWYPKKNTDIQLRWMAVVSRYNDPKSTNTL